MTLMHIDKTLNKQDIIWHLWKLTMELIASFEQEVAFYPRNTAGRLNIFPRTN